VVGTLADHPPALERFTLKTAVGPGGTVSLAVLGGNLPPSRTHGHRLPIGEVVVRAAVGRVARQNGPVARSTQQVEPRNTRKARKSQSFAV
jgi:hypothetical protein